MDGKDADPELIRSMLAEAVGALPPAPAGEPGPQGPAGDRGPAGLDGKDADPEVIKALVVETVATIPPPKDGADGAPGPQGPMGDQGPAGAPGRDGQDVDPAELARLDERITEQWASIAKLDERITEQRAWIEGAITDAVERATAGASEQTKRLVDAALATAPSAFLLNDAGDLVCVRRDGTLEKLGLARGADGKDGAPGKDGADGAPGLSFEDMTVEFDGRRSITFRFARGEQVYEKRLELPIPLYMGVYKADQKYSVGDCVTHDGALWMARQQDLKKPGDGDKSGWQLAVKSSKNGKSAFEIARALGWRGTSEKEWLASLKGPEGRPGPMGPPGRDRS